MSVGSFLTYLFLGLVHSFLSFQIKEVNHMHTTRNFKLLIRKQTDNAKTKNYHKTNNIENVRQSNTNPIKSWGVNRFSTMVSKLPLHVHISVSHVSLNYVWSLKVIWVKEDRIFVPTILTYPSSYSKQISIKVNRLVIGCLCY